MFTLKNNNLNYYKPNYYRKTNSFTKLKPNTNLKNYPLLSKFYSNLTAVQTIAQYFENNTYTINTDIQPQIIITPEQTFTLASNPSNPQSGEFIFQNNQVLVYSNTPITTPVTLVTSPLNIKSFKVKNIPQFLYNLPIQGGFSISHSFQDHPSSSFVFVTTRKNLALYRSRFKNGRIIELYNYAFRIISYTEEIIPDTNEVTISINLRGLQEFYTNRPTLLRDTVITTNELDFDPECSAFAEKFNEKNPININIQKLAQKAGTNIIGISFNIPTPPDPNDDTTTTISAQLEQYLDIRESFVDYTNRNKIVVKKINEVKTWIFNENDLLSSFSTNINSNPVNPIVDNNFVPEEIKLDLTSEIPNTITNINTNFNINEDLNNIPIPSLQNVVLSNYFTSTNKLFKEEQVLQKNRRYEKRTPEILFDKKGDLDIFTIPDNISEIRDLTLNFDNGGVTKTLIETVTEDGITLTERTIRFGFCYTAYDIMKTGIDPDTEENKIYLETLTPLTYWKLIEDSTITYIYDKDTGYLLGYDQIGRRLLRYQVEDESLPTITIRQLDQDPQDREPLSLADQQRLKSYDFIYVPIYGAKRFLLAQHKDYYSDFQSQERQYKKCLPDGKSVWVDDPTFVDSMFVLAENEEKQCFNWIEHPDNILDSEELAELDPEEVRIFKPPLITGEESYNRNYIKILTSKNTRKSQGYTIDGYPEQDRYEQYTSNFSAQEPGFSTIVENTNFTTNNGIPSQHTRKPPKYELEETEEKNNKKEDLFKYIFYTKPYDGLYPRTGNISFDRATSLEEIEKGVKHKLKIEDMRNTLTSSVTVPFNLDYRCGDKVVININGIVFKRRILNLTHNFIIDGLTNEGIPNLLSDGTTLTLCIDRDIEVYKRKERVLNKRYHEQILIINEEKILGTLLPKRNRTRGNYRGQQ